MLKVARGELALPNCPDGGLAGQFFQTNKKLVSAEVQRLGRPEKPEGSLCVIAAQPFVLCPAQIQGPDDWRVVYIRRVINPLVVRIGKPGVTNKDYVLPTVLL